ncbi:MAG: thioesterase family protein [Pirellulaceae bacterium]
MRTFTYQVRVRYQETDGQGHVHHANYLTYFEQSRVEMLRAIGQSYREIERSGAILVVTEMDVRYQSPAYFDDELLIEVMLVKAKGARLEHEYRVFRVECENTDVAQGRPIVTARSVVACIGRNGKPCRLPNALKIQGETGR